MGRGDLRRPPGVRSRAEGVRWCPDAVVSARDNRLLVDRVRDRLTEAQVLERGVRRAELRRVARRRPGVGVQRQLVEATLLPLNRNDALGLRKVAERRRLDVVSRVDLALLQREDLRVLVREDPEHDLVDRGLPMPVVGIRLHPDVLALGVLLERERPRADAVLRRVLRQVPLGDLGVDVLGDDVDIHRRKLRIGDRRTQDDRARVRRRGRDVSDRRGVVEPLLCPRAVDRVGHVVGSQRLTVRPFQVRSQCVGPRPAVVRALPRGGEPRDRLEVRGCLVGERRVLHVPDLVVDHERADGGVERVDVLREPDRQRDLPGRVGRGSNPSEEGEAHRTAQCSGHDPPSAVHEGSLRRITSVAIMAAN